MRLTCLVIVAVFAGCLGNAAPGPNLVQDAAADQGSTVGPPEASKAPPASSEGGADVGGGGSPQPQHADPNATARPPAPMHWEGRMGILALPAAGPWPDCEAPLTGCDGPFFTIGGTFDVQATLSWDRPTNDLDLHLCRWSHRSCDEVSHDGINNGTELATRQVLRHADLPAGSYRLWIVPRHGVDMEYRLDAVFT